MHVCSDTANGCGDSRTLVGVSQLLHMRRARVHPWENSLTLGGEKMRLGSSQLLRLDAVGRSRWNWERALGYEAWSTAPSVSDIRTSSGRDRAFIFRMTCPR